MTTDEITEGAEDIRQERITMRLIRARLSCTDGFCGAEDCRTCRPWIDDREEDDSE